jgi:hypothetical protein
MWRKIVAGGFVAVMIAAVVIGIVRLATPAAEAQGRGPGRAVEGSTTVGRGNGGWGQGGGSSALEPDAGTALGTQDTQSQGRGYGGRAAAAGSGQAATEQTQGDQGQRGQGQGGSPSGTGTGEPQAEVQEWVSIEGTVVETAELTIETAGGEMLQVGLGPSHYREGQGFTLSEGDLIRVGGYWEDGEFKAGEVENLSTGTKITLRDAYGRPMWSGRGRGNS